MPPIFKAVAVPVSPVPVPENEPVKAPVNSVAVTLVKVGDPVREEPSPDNVVAATVPVTVRMLVVGSKTRLEDAPSTPELFSCSCLLLPAARVVAAFPYCDRILTLGTYVFSPKLDRMEFADTI